MKKYDVDKFIESIEDNPNVDKLKQIKVEINSLPFNINKRYYFKYNGKKYRYQKFTEVFNLQEYDKKIMKDKELRNRKVLFRSLKLTCSLDLVNPKLVIANTLNCSLNTLITYQENGVERLIDYSGNLVMDKKDYYELFEVREINVLDRVDLYKIDVLLEKYDDYENMFEYLLFTKEKFEDLASSNPILKDKYDKDGINYRNHSIIGNSHDCILFQEEDWNNQKYEKVVEELKKFTANPTKDNKYFKYIENGNYYKYHDGLKMNFVFDLLSTYADDEEEKDELLSFERYGNCYVDSDITAFGLLNSGIDNIYIVGGKMKSNEIDYIHHCWLELEKTNETIVIDYTNNLVIEKSKYYQIYEAVMISKTKAEDMEKIKDIVEPVINHDYAPILYTFFGKEMMNDIKKNEKILLKK